MSTLIALGQFSQSLKPLLSAVYYCILCLCNILSILWLCRRDNDDVFLCFVCWSFIHWMM